MVILMLAIVVKMMILVLAVVVVTGVTQLGRVGQNSQSPLNEPNPILYVSGVEGLNSCVIIRGTLCP